jgi:hypothetical protein
MMDNIVLATNSMRSSVTGMKKKLSALRVQVEAFDVELEKISAKFDNLITQADIYKSKLEREMGREVRRLERELALLQKAGGQVTKASTQVSPCEINIASTVAIFDSILRLICENATDFRLASEAFLFPAVYERVITGTEDAYFLTEVPSAAALVISRGREYVTWIRSEYATHLTDPDTWKDAIEYIREWWANDALPMLYGARDEQWDIDASLSLQEMVLWRDSPGDRPLNFASVFEAYEIYRKNKDVIYESTGLREFELKHFVNEG